MSKTMNCQETSCPLRPHAKYLRLQLPHYLDESHECLIVVLFIFALIFLEDLIGNHITLEYEYVLHD